MTTVFKNKVIKNIGTATILGLSTDVDTRNTIIGLSLTNLTDAIVYVTILLKDDSAVEGNYLKNVPIPPNSSLRALNSGEKLILAPQNELLFSCSQVDGIDAVISYVEMI